MENIIKRSYDLVINDSNFVKLTTFSLLPYSLLFVWYIFYQTYFFIHTMKVWFHLYELKVYMDSIFKFWQHFWYILLVIAVLIIIFYVFFPPIAEWALITYLDKKKWIWSSIWLWFTKFFPMFELHGFISLFSFLWFFIIISRLYMADMLGNIFVWTFVVIWFIITMFLNFSIFYAKYLIILDGYTTFDAIKHSIKLSFLNLWKTWKYFKLYLILYLRFLINVIILIWLPIIILITFLKLNIWNIEIVKYSIYGIMWLLFFLTAYMNWIIEAFFISMWYNIFKEIDKE